MNKSFTLIELLIVIAIIAIMAVGIIILTIPGQRLAQARDTTRAAHLKNLETALYLHDLDHGLSNLTITENLTEICNTELENYDCTGLVDLSSLNITIPTDPLGGNSPNGTGYYLALINNKAVLYATKAETKETKIGIAEGITFIYAWEDLYNIRNNLEGHYILMNNLSSATVGYDDYNTGDGWEPIGNEITPFEGIFDGNNKIIIDLVIDRIGTDYVGLFGSINNNSEVKNIGLINLNIKASHVVGGLVGYNNEGIINNSYVIGFLRGLWGVGGLIGWNTGDVSFSYSNIEIEMGAWESGGLIGYNQGNISDSYSVGFIEGNYHTGGLVGENTGTISNSYSNVNVLASYFAGGLVAGNYGDGIIINCYATGNIKTTSSSEGGVGGLVGLSSGEIRNSYSIGDSEGKLSVGGLVGYNLSNNLIINSYSIGNVSGDNFIGGLVGHHNVNSTVLNSYFNKGPDNEVGIYESDETNFYLQTHNVYQEEPNWTSPPWSWLADDFPKLNI